MTKNHATGLAAFHGPGKTITRDDAARIPVPAG